MIWKRQDLYKWGRIIVADSIWGKAQQGNRCYSCERFNKADMYCFKHDMPHTKVDARKVDMESTDVEGDAPQAADSSARIGMS
jgi:hypothetical protein